MKLLSAGFLHCPYFLEKSRILIWVTIGPAVTVKTFGLLPDQGWFWLDFLDFKHDYIKKVYQSEVCFVGCGAVNFAVTGPGKVLNFISFSKKSWERPYFWQMQVEQMIMPDGIYFIHLASSLEQNSWFNVKKRVQFSNTVSQKLLSNKLPHKCDAFLVHVHCKICCEVLVS